MDRELSNAELREIERHKYLMSQEEGRDVELERAAQDWLANHAELWRKHRQVRMLELQRKEIERYKWIESEKAQRDLGREASLDWIRKYAARWRDWYENEVEEDEDADAEPF